MKTAAKIVLLSLLVGAGAWWYFNRPPLGQVLVFSKTAGYRHDSIAAGISALTEIAGRHRIAVVATEDSSQFSEEILPAFDAVVFLNTTGSVLNSEQQEVLQRYIQAGGGFVGIHSAVDTHWKNNDWPWYTRLVGAAFLSHPSEPSNVQAGVLRVEDSEHPATAMFEPQFSFTDEWYDYHRLSRHLRVLLSIDESSYQGAVMGEQHPVAWYQDYDGGRSFYTNFGHRAESFEDPLVRRHLWAGLEYAMGTGELDYGLAAPERWRLKRVILDSGLDEPMAMDFTPDGDIYYIQRKGELMRYDPQRQASVEVARLEVMSSGEYGLIGLAFDPAYAENHWLYIFRNIIGGDDALYRLSRFQLRDGLLDHGSEQVILDIPTESGEASHTGGTLLFGPEGHLWISTGDTTNPHESNGFSPLDDRPGRREMDAARSAGNTMDLRGKILRIVVGEDGSYSVPAGNLFRGGEGGRPEIYVMGLRNPFRFDLDRRTGTLYWGEVGPDSREYSASRGPWGYDEFNRTDRAGNFGWPFLIGANEPYARFDFETGTVGAFFDPAAPENYSANNTGSRVLPPAQPAWIAYPYTLNESFIELGEGGRSAMAGPVYYHGDYPANPIRLPPYFDKKLFIYEWMRRWVQAVQMDDDGGVIKIEPVMNIGLFSAPIHLKFAPDGSLYVLEYGSAWFAQNDDAFLTRIEYYGEANPPPTVKVSVDQRVGAAPLTTTLRGSDSFDRNGDFDSLGFSWDLVENGRVIRHIADTPDTEFTAATSGDHRLRLTVTDAEGASSENGLILEVGNDAPRIEITFNNGNRTVFGDGSSIDYRVTVTDAEDGSTEDGSIDPGRVVVSLQYIPQGEDLAGALLGHQAAAGASDGWSEIEGSDCLSCHTRDKPSVGPSFRAMAERYTEDVNAKTLLSDRILNGGSGNWGQHAMPPHPQLTQEQASSMAGWIVNPDAPETVPSGLPLAGTLVFDRHLGDYIDADMIGKLYTGRYLLLASYTDQGAPGARPQRAEVSQIWLPPVLSAAEASAMQSIETIPPPMGEVGNLELGIYTGDAQQRAWLQYANVDLGGIAALRVGIATSRLFTSGGEIGLRLAAPDGELIGKHVVENTNIGMPDKLDYFLFDVSGIERSADIYLTSEGPLPEGVTRPYFILATLEFLN